LPSQNQLLASLPAADFALIAPHLKAVDLGMRMNLQEPKKVISWAYFPSAGIASVIATATGGRQVEVGLIGREGMTGLSILLACDRSPHEIFIQVPGHGDRLDAKVLRGIFDKNPSIHRAMLRYVDAFITQMAQTALANAKAIVSERLARWLLMSRDRVDGDEIRLTHEFLSLMLGVRRAGVTTALQELEGLGLIETNRGIVRTIDRTKLKDFANGFYGA
jgi:CRP-like cAMP-binding protein